MAYSHHERLTALDTSFLSLEDRSSHMHVGAVALFDAGPLSRPEGGLDFDRIRAFVESRLHRIPRYRQRLAWTPVTGDAVWVDDETFRLGYHLRHTALPHPGDERQLKRLAGRIFSQQLDRGKPLWEMWVVEGLEGNRFAVVSKIHHCMVDGVAGVELTAAILRPGPDSTVKEPHAWVPRPAPGDVELAWGQLRRRLATGVGAVGAAAGAVRRPLRTVERLRGGLANVGEVLAAGLSPGSPTPLNGDIGPHRRFDWIHFPLDEVKEVRAKLGGTLNDVVLAVVAGAVRRFLLTRGENVRKLEFRVLVPVNVRRPEQSGEGGNRVATLNARLPLERATPRERLEAVREEMQRIKGSRQVKGVEMLEELSDTIASSLMIEFARLAASSRTYNMTVTNVPGPPIRVHLLGAEMREIYPLVPLFRNQALGIALFTYAGSLYWGFNACWDTVPDLHDFALGIASEFEALRKAAADG